ncbi:invasion associated locus B family protein [uncultured Roseibium sp.]|uniref:invasion associated locus B family protein n=1 Tax=uncultured Roseibium sp. TaxID=1936171 RepID=UPI003216CCF2
MFHSFFKVFSGTVAAVCFLLLSFTQAFAAEDADTPSQTTATFGDWTVQCRLLDDKSTKLCEMLQAIAAKDNKGLLAKIAVGRLPGKEAMRVVVQLPLAVHLGSPVELRVGDKVAVKAPYETCYPDFCLAGAVFSDAAAQIFKKAKAMTIVFADRSGAAKGVPVSLTGFTAAFKKALDAPS